MRWGIVLLLACARPAQASSACALSAKPLLADVDTLAGVSGCRAQAHQGYKDLLRTATAKRQIEIRFHWGEAVASWCQSECTAEVRKEGRSALEQVISLTESPGVRRKAQDLLVQLEPETDWLTLGLLSGGGALIVAGGAFTYFYFDAQDALSEGYDKKANQTAADRDLVGLGFGYVVGVGLLSWGLVRVLSDDADVALTVGPGGLAIGGTW